jgi:hypothetical protein
MVEFSTSILQDEHPDCCKTSGIVYILAQSYSTMRVKRAIYPMMYDSIQLELHLTSVCSSDVGLDRSGS